MLEIKVPYSRVPNGKIKIGYYIQMQTQMEVCDMDVCDFFECNISEYRDKKSYDADQYNAEDNYFIDVYPKTVDLTHVTLCDDRRTEDGLEKGMIGRIGYFSTGNDNEYFYPPMNMTSQQQYEWLQDKKKELATKNQKMVIDYWKIETTSYNEVMRDKKWWKENDVENKLRATWKKVEENKKRKLLNTLPNTIPKTIAKTIPKTIPNTIPKTIPNTIPKTMPNTIAKTIPKTIAKTIPKTIPNTIPFAIPVAIPVKIPVAIQK